MPTTLLRLHIDLLICRLNNSNVGCYVGSLRANAFAYDDVIILSPTCSALR